MSPTPNNEEYSFSKGLILSTTDLDGIMTYANRKFCEISGYSNEELVGQDHNIIRHPDMPKSIFKDLWESIKDKKEWTGVIKNLRKDGKYYWVYSYISPIILDDEHTGYAAARRPASSTEIEESIESYAELRQNEN